MAKKVTYERWINLFLPDGWNEREEMGFVLLEKDNWPGMIQLSFLEREETKTPPAEAARILLEDTLEERDVPFPREAVRVEDVGDVSVAVIDYTNREAQEPAHWRVWFLVDKTRAYGQREQSLDRELGDHQALSDQYQDDIRQLEDKLKTAREKQRLLVQRHIHAERKRRAQEDIRRVDSAETMFKFDELENRIERMEAEADLVNFAHKNDLEDRLDRLSVDDDIEAELEALKAARAGTEKTS